MIGKTVSHYRIVEKLGGGGMGVVYKAEDTKLGRFVALKFLPEELAKDRRALEQLEREARAASALNHPHICTVYEVGEADGHPYIAMESVAGQPISALVPEGGLAVEAIIRYGTQIADALEHAHARGIIHRDLKGSNVLVTPEGRAKVLDFGLARDLRQEQLDEVTRSQATLADAGTIAGTLPYMAPELLRGEPADARSDLWAFGVMLYEMAAGQLPFKGRTAFELSSAIMREPPTPLPERVPLGLRAIIQRCLAKETTQRYQRASEVRAALEAIQSGQAVVVPAPSRPKPWRALASVGLTLIVLLVFATAVPSVRQRVRRWLGVVHVPQEKRVAVLPFSAVGGDGEGAAFARGLTETLTVRLTQLTQNRSLDVVPPSEVRAKGVATVEQARQQFGVNLGLEGSLQRSGDMLRVTYSLVDANTLRQLHGEAITAKVSDPFGLEDRVADSVVGALEIELQPRERQALSAHGTAEPAAYDYYLRGRGYLQEYQKAESVESAIAVFSHALEKDPNYALALAGLGEAYWRKYQLNRDSEWVGRAKAACERAVASQSLEASSHACLGLVYNGTGQYEQAVAQYQQAVELEPTGDFAYSGLASAYEHLSNLEGAEKTYRRAIGLRPHYWAGYNWLGVFYWRHARYAEAARMFTQVVALAPDSFVGYSNLGAMYILEGRYADAIPVLRKSIAIRPSAGASSNLATAYFQLRRFSEAARTYEEATLNDRDYEIWGNLGDAYYWAPGKRAQAAAAYRKAVALADERLKVNPRDATALGFAAWYHAVLGEKEPALSCIQRAVQIAPRDPELLFNAALVYNQLGDVDRTLAWLDQALSAGFSPATIRNTPNFDILRADPRFEDILRRH